MGPGHLEVARLPSQRDHHNHSKQVSSSRQHGLSPLKDPAPPSIALGRPQQPETHTQNSKQQRFSSRTSHQLINSPRVRPLLCFLYNGVEHFKASFFPHDSPLGSSANMVSLHTRQLTTKTYINYQQQRQMNN